MRLFIAFLLLFQFSRKLDDLLAILYNDREADTVQVAQEALAVLKEKVDAIGKLGLKDHAHFHSSLNGKWSG